MGAMQRAKGARVERELVNKLRKEGFEAQRVPLSGATTYAKGDVEVLYFGKKMVIEVKSRKDGFKEIYKFLECVLEDYWDGCYLEPENLRLSIDQIAPRLKVILRDNYPRPKSLGTLLKLRKDCDMLALRANNMPWIFIK